MIVPLGLWSLRGPSWILRKTDALATSKKFGKKHKTVHDNSLQIALPK
jgi:hypothetical protein